PKKIAEAVNPKGEEAYTGPFGTLSGRVTITGDPPPDTSFKYDKRCAEGEATFHKLFRVGTDNALADALVTATNYGKFVPASAQTVKATIHGCAPRARTVALTFGQRLDVANTDKIDSYVPFLDGGTTKAMMVAVPGGDPVRMYPDKPGHYM